MSFPYLVDWPARARCHHGHFPASRLYQHLLHSGGRHVWYAIAVCSFIAGPDAHFNAHCIDKSTWWMRALAYMWRWRWRWQRNGFLHRFWLWLLKWCTSVLPQSIEHIHVEDYYMIVWLACCCKCTNESGAVMWVSNWRRRKVKRTWISGMNDAKCQTIPCAFRLRPPDRLWLFFLFLASAQKWFQVKFIFSGSRCIQSL